MVDTLQTKDQLRGSINNKAFTQKLYTLNRKNPILTELFRKSKPGYGKIEETKKQSETIRTKMTRGNLRASISRRYKGAIAERVVNLLQGFQNPVDFDSYIEMIEKLLNFDKDRLMKIAFDVYDYNQDKLICELDSYTNMKNFADDDEVYVQAFSYDLCLIGEALDQKR